MVNRQLSEQFNQGKSLPNPLPNFMQNETDTMPSSPKAFCQADAAPLHRSRGGAQSKEQPGEPMELPTAWGHPAPYTLPRPLLVLVHQLSSKLGTWPWRQILAQIPASITARSDTSAVVPAHQPHPRSTLSLGQASSRGKAGASGSLSGSHSSRAREEWIDWRLQMLTDNLHWRMAAIHQHKTDIASYQDYLKMSGS